MRSSCVLVLLAVGLAVQSLAFDFPIIDTHVHLSNFSLLSYSWNIPKVTNCVLRFGFLLSHFWQQINRNWTCDDYKFASQNSFLPTQEIVFVEVSCNVQSWVDEVVWVQSLTTNPTCNLPFLAIIGHVGLQFDNASTVLDTMIQKSPLFRGVRQVSLCRLLNAHLPPREKLATF